MTAAEALLDQLAELVADRVVAKMAARPSPTERVYQADAEAHGAHWRWIVDRAREGRIVLRGARGRRYVLASELAELLNAATIKTPPRRPSHAAEALENTRAVVAALARKRA